MAPLARLRDRPAIALIAVLALIAALVLGAVLKGQPPRERPLVGLFTSLPIYWGEAADIADLLSAEREQHWVRGELERQYRLQPLDVLVDGEGSNSLAELRYLVLAQPRALSPVENVALDGWVRRGGRLLLFADPMLTEESHFGLGDRRRPQDVVLISPILTRWGLRLEFDDMQPEGLRLEPLFGMTVPVDLAGRLATLSGSGTCALSETGLGAECRVGKGRVLIVADAALLDGHTGDDDQRKQALSDLVGRIFAPD